VTNLWQPKTARALRVLHVVRSLNVGGLEMGVVNLVNGLHRLGVRQAVCCLEQRGALADRVPAEVPAWGCAEGRRRVWQRPELRAARLIHEFQPHVVHARNCGAWVDAGLAWVLAQQPGRLMFSIHGFDVMQRVSRKWALIYRQLARLTHAMAAVSSETAHEFARETGIPVSRFTVLSSGVDTQRFHPALDWPRPVPAEQRLVFGYVARLGTVKGHDILIRAFARAVHEFGVNAELRLVGDGPLRPGLEALAQERGVTDRVHFLGTRDDVPDQLRSFDVFVLASEREGRPTSIMEAMACGLPVVATDVGSVRGLVAEGVTGLVVAPSDVDGLARGLCQIATDPALRQRFARAARAEAESRLSLDSMLRAYLQFYGVRQEERASAAA
jgi:glycosyltransferase involved in cell wall biosynthesis